jgi:hypothetical protein
MQTLHPADRVTRPDRVEVPSELEAEIRSIGRPRGRGLWWGVGALVVAIVATLLWPIATSQEAEVHDSWMNVPPVAAEAHDSWMNVSAIRVTAPRVGPTDDGSLVLAPIQANGEVHDSWMMTVLAKTPAEIHDSWVTVTP